MQIDTVVPQMERLSNEVRGDPLQMLEVQCAAYRAYSQILHNQIKYLNRKNAAARKTKEMQNTATTSHEIQFRALLEQELLSENYNCFVDHVNETFKNAFLGAGENWLKLGASIISKETTFEVLKEMKVKLPLCYTFFVTLSVSPSQKGRSRYEQSSHEKELMGLLAFLRGARQRNCKKLTWWALVNTIVYMSRGVTKIAIQKSVDDRDALSISACINNKLPQIRNSMENSAKRLLARETFVLVGFDNMQVVKPLKSQRDGRSSCSITGTVMYALCMDYILPKIGMKLLGPSDKIHTIQDAKRIVNGSVVVTAKGVDGVCTEVNLPSHAWSLILTEPPCEFTFIQPTPRIVIESWPFAINELSFEKSKTEILFSPNPSKAQACMSAKNLREIYSLINSCKQFKKYLSKRSLIDELTSDANEWSISIASVFSVITRSKKRLENATSFPARLSALYGALSENSSKVSILPLSEHDDISIAGAEKNLAKIIELVSLSSGIDYRHFYIAG
eukprot:CAMPEP_0196825686 /NCGR_PEP_ID=MMETSP1362-20130617/93202_1 /TAXON_ID=163516 /ORGANISM="Leptocylindrus danicus, Strain CCMP1856" /LENGTH=505 /DNA_ID=CAMNT_0042206163 /DNA_START=1336 /DNA_END=2850 /DNA_ORIENTATION=+